MNNLNIEKYYFESRSESQYSSQAPFKLDQAGASEQVGFSVRNLRICHQNEWRNMTVDLEYDVDSMQNPVDVQKVKKHVLEFLNNYPNQADFWEIMNTKLIRSLIDLFPEIRSLRSKLSLAPDRTLSFHRASTAVYEKGEEVLRECFAFTKPQYAICNDTFRLLDMHVDFSLKPNPTALDYPDYQWVDQAMEEFFSKNRLSFSKWKNLKPQLENFLLERFPTLTGIDIRLTVSE